MAGSTGRNAADSDPSERQLRAVCERAAGGQGLRCCTVSEFGFVPETTSVGERYEAC